jgi:soluble lytic murein transglycosylase-like protein
MLDFGLYIIIYTNSIMFGLNPDKVFSIIETESRFKVDAVGSLGELGLFQIRPEYWKYPLDINNPEHHIGYSISKLAQLKSRLKPKLGDEWFLAWNMGPTGALRLKDKIELHKVRYVQKVYSRVNL